jgi:hypothetical protein
MGLAVFVCAVLVGLVAAAAMVAGTKRRTSDGDQHPVSVEGLILIGVCVVVAGLALL